ncbi:MAG: aminotransferase class I/II-fold pyridoxal phosphate-dependent enzyme, partial [Candidatus Hadarchaeum sp.]
ERRRKAVLKELEKLPGISYVRPKGAFYVFPDFSRWGKNDENLAKELLNKTHVCTAPGSGFGESGRGHLRISYSAPYEQVVTGISRIVETLQEK